jgi:uncharacterized protein (DUF1684 family)
MRVRAGAFTRLVLVCAAALLASLPSAHAQGAAATTATTSPSFDEAAWRQSVQEWRERADAGLRRDNGWLTLAGRYVLKPGVTRIGAAADNDIVLPKGTAPDHVGSVELTMQGPKGRVLLKSAQPGASLLFKDGMPFDERALATAGEGRDWVQVAAPGAPDPGRLQFHVIERKPAADAKSRNMVYVLRLADNGSELRKNFAGRIWFDLAPAWRVEAQYRPYKRGHTIAIVDVLGELHDMPAPGYVEFTPPGAAKPLKLDAVAEPGDKELFFILKDATAGKETYAAARFMVAAAPSDLTKPGKVVLDFNRAYNPPCAFSAYTTCPLPPEQNQLALRIEAGEKVRKPAGD